MGPALRQAADLGDRGLIPDIQRQGKRLDAEFGVQLLVPPPESAHRAARPGSIARLPRRMPAHAAPMPELAPVIRTMVFLSEVMCGAPDRRLVDW